ncbi:hypothetical protein GCM10011611_67010 [Aliidongia dinghuensis]|uniref:Uncharacterized protein n=1 Tax=Aliidongia dinghuensis TaxID=1867774 RepID=A0A8J3E749_9PROT|nr:hypothetical protein [Aliidongia dinghuensis]GGF51161.1 hypothetical protein GCM10011611_67010 [Aliidongia dinghuensis]
MGARHDALPDDLEALKAVLLAERAEQAAAPERAGQVEAELAVARPKASDDQALIVGTACRRIWQCSLDRNGRRIRAARNHDHYRNRRRPGEHPGRHGDRARHWTGHRRADPRHDGGHGAPGAPRHGGEIVGRDRKYEIGEMAAAVQTFKDSMIETDRLAALQAA